MALHAETFVEEWFNRNGYFTIRGLKDKIDECDILAVKNTGDGEWDCIHCEVQVSIRPVGYISKLTSEAQIELQAKTKTSAKIRPELILEQCAKAWVTNKFTATKKYNLRKQLISNGDWGYMFVHGNVKDERELSYIEAQGVELFSFRKIIEDMRTKQTSLQITGSSAGDMIDMLEFT
ncbi:hypothetical protein [Alkalicoccobacillus porphyridii]|uniref:Uncharacterized protein n=1 Tax=Alkalicoccobacillus porphyridii TaxID=2597270 RepID=A0A554A1X7_9BACI|nr:hypothetical protein [Alkalicoccobacillus porphyridii]TSB47692.1 hypothetical protein FN960_04020 [Alkalicoccobacillus porphyridii]